MGLHQRPQGLLRRMFLLAKCPRPDLLASRGGAAGILGVYGLTYVYSQLEDEEDDIRDAITLRVLSGEIDESYLDQMDAPIDYIGAIEGIRWW